MRAHYMGMYTVTHRRMSLSSSIAAICTLMRAWPSAMPRSTMCASRGCMGRRAMLRPCGVIMPLKSSAPIFELVIMCVCDLSVLAYVHTRVIA